MLPNSQPDYGVLQAEYQAEVDALDGIRGREYSARRAAIDEKYNQERAEVQRVAADMNLPEDLAKQYRKELQALPGGGRGWAVANQRVALQRRYQAQAQERADNQYIDQTAARLGITRDDLLTLAQGADQVKQSKQAELRQAYERELAEFRRAQRGNLVGFTQLQTKYRRLGLEGV